MHYAQFTPVDTHTRRDGGVGYLKSRDYSRLPPIENNESEHVTNISK